MPAGLLPAVQDCFAVKSITVGCGGCASGSLVFLPAGLLPADSLAVAFLGVAFLAGVFLGALGLGGALFAAFFRGEAH